MKIDSTIRIFLLAWLPAFAIPATAEPAPEPECDRACLTDFADTYIQALEERNPTMAPFAPSVRFTENGSELALGDALWATIDSVSDTRLVFADPKRHSTVIFTSIVENGQPAILSARLRTHGREIIELETMVTRQRPGFFAPENFGLTRPLWTQEEEPEHHASREALVKIVDSYFEGIVLGRGDITPFDDDCMRYENGVAATRNPDLGTDIRNMGCREQFETGMLKLVTSITNRRYFLIDEERQIVVASVLFNHKGNVLSVPRADGSIYKPQPPYTQPTTLLITEAFKITNGRIVLIEALLQNVPYRMDPGWEN